MQVARGFRSAWPSAAGAARQVALALAQLTRFNPMLLPNFLMLHTAGVLLSVAYGRSLFIPFF